MISILFFPPIYLVSSPFFQLICKGTGETLSNSLSSLRCRDLERLDFLLPPQTNNNHDLDKLLSIVLSTAVIIPPSKVDQLLQVITTTEQTQQGEGESAKMERIQPILSALYQQESCQYCKMDTSMVGSLYFTQDEWNQLLSLLSSQLSKLSFRVIFLIISELFSSPPLLLYFQLIFSRLSTLSL